MIPPIYFAWDGEAMVPKQPQLADKYYTIGETYRLEVRDEVSKESRGHFFASLKEAWLNLPDCYNEQFPSVESMRKFGLIKSGYSNLEQIPCASTAEAERVAAIARRYAAYSVVTILGENVVNVFTAESQSAKAMGKKRFQESKTAVLDWAASLIGVDRNQLEENAKRVA